MIQYFIEARCIGSRDWYPFNIAPISAEEAIAALARLADSDDTTVFRAVPSEPKSCQQCDTSVGFVCEEHGEDERCWHCCGIGEIDGEECYQCNGTGFASDEEQE